MSYNIYSENPLTKEPARDVVVYYDKENYKFLVELENGCGYTVDRGAMVNDLCKYVDRVVGTILDVLPEDVEYNVVLTANAQNEIYLIQEANCFLF